MRTAYSHPSDEQLLMFADGELSSLQSSQVKRHLDACWECRSRLEQTHQTITNFVQVYHSSLDPELPSGDGPRALLKAHLAQLSEPAAQPSWLTRLQGSLTTMRVAGIAALFLVAATGSLWWRGAPQSPVSHSQRFQTTAGLIPDRRLTPGSTRQMSTSDVCSTSYSDDTQLVPASVREKVLHEYGVPDTRLGEYELDYLISPQLGGTNDASNLWPELASSTGWNTQVKDALENRLHQLVCQGKINLPTAQQELSTDWISAYKRYFHTDRPVERPS